jgi:hypothetical protein
LCEFIKILTGNLDLNCCVNYVLLQVRTRYYIYLKKQRNNE